jgi:uncharacterized protein YgiM (DUF1202 family)
MQTNFQPANLQLVSKSIPSHPLVLIGLVASLLALAACQPVRDPAVVAAERTAIASGTTVPVTGAATVGTPEATETLASPAVEPATATISTRSARVRTLPSEEGEVVAAVNEGDNFPVIGISSDGGWIQLSIEEAPDGTGWISAELVTLVGDITNIEVVDIATAEATEEVATEEATVEATEEATEEATAEATAEATVEATEEVTETVEATTEATEEATPEPAVEVTEEATVEVTEEATVEATVEATPEVTATLEVTEEITETVEATPEATDEATTEEEATDEASTPDVGTDVTIVTDLPLRVRSEPTAEVENKIGNVFNGEVYTVLAVSDDGLWLQIEVPGLGDGTGWISAEFVSYGEAG